MFSYILSFPGSVCPSCILCEMCRHSHDPSHSLVRTKTPLSIPEHGMSGEFRFPRRGDRTVRKAERQRLKAERRQLRAEVKEIKKKLRLEKRGLQSQPCHLLLPQKQPQGPPQSQGFFSTMLCTLETRGPGVSHSSLVPTMAALFLDENLPDGTRLEPGTKFIKYWKMKNSGTISWTSETKLVFMWGNLSLASEERREVPVPLLLPGQVGVVSVAFVAPVMEGTYTSHWRLAHCGCQFGPRVWCSIVVDPGNNRATLRHQSKRLAMTLLTDSGCAFTVDLPHEDYYFPSVDLLTAQDLLSFELLDINIVQELEKVPNNTPVDLTPCISPLPHDAPVLEKSVVTPMKEDPPETTGVRKLFGESCRVKLRQQEVLESVTQEDEKEEEISGAQFLCETVIRSLTLEEAPDHRPLRRAQHGSHKQKSEAFCSEKTADSEDAEKEKVSSQTSSVSSGDDYIIVLPDCFDTSRPLGESMYSSAMSQPETVETETIAVEESLENTWPPHVSLIHSSLTSIISEHDSVCNRGQGGITEGFVKGALSVAASAYKALFTGPNCSIQDPSMMAVLMEMGFKDQRLNLQLLRKHNYSLLHTVNELVQMAEEIYF
uniref:NBR1 autophagy cargo receptor a n=1 Tax=Nothobranchius furzeri TaxID=105023 RepID=A0A8C6P563_NOTFU